MRAVFVVGTGRSGTHFTVRLLNGFEKAVDPMGGKENKDVLWDVADSAIRHRTPSDVTIQYYKDCIEQADGVFLDQHHPNIHFMRQWKEILGPEVVFLFPDRPTYQVVASMMRHKGVMSWYRYANGIKNRTITPIPFPNRFLGLDKRSEIKSLPTHMLCARRVIQHRQLFKNAVEDMGGQLRAVNYESLVNDPLAEFGRVFSEAEMADLGEFTLKEEPKPASLSKFKDVLSDEQVEEINALEKAST